MEKLKKAVALLILAAMVVTVLTGCGGTATGEDADTAAATTAGNTSDTTAAAEIPFKDPMEISIAMWGIRQAVDSGKPDAVRDRIYKDLNITIKPMNVTWDDYTQKIQVWAVSGQLPDLFAMDLFGFPNYSKWIDQGLIHELPKDLSAYPELEKLYKSEGFDIYKYPMDDTHGKIYAIPRLTHTNVDDWSTDYGVMLRKDWMQKVGVTKEPETMDEFTDLMKKFTANDCNGNGLKDEIGLTMYNTQWLYWFFLGYQPGLVSGSWVKDPADPTKWTLAFMTPETLEGVKALKNLYDTGGMDKDFANIKGEEGRDKFAASIAGAYSHDVTPFTLAYVKEQFDKMPQNEGIHFEDVITLLKPFKNTDGNYYRRTNTPAWSESYINAACEDKKVDRILRLMNYVMDEKGYNLLHFGIEGLDWHKEGDRIVLTPQKDAGGKEQSLSVTYPICGAAFLMEWSGTRQWTTPMVYPKLQQLSGDLNTWLQANAIAARTDLKIADLDVPGKEKAAEYFPDDLVKLILSKDVDKTWNEMIAAYKLNGYDTYIQEINAKCAELGIKPQ